MPGQNNSSQDQFWSLLSKKLSKEANAEDLEELHSILLSNPDLHHHANMLTEMWQQGSLNKGIRNEAAYMRHIMKHKDEFFVEEDSIEINTDDAAYLTNPGFLRAFFSRKRSLVYSFLGLIITTGVIYLFTQNRDAKLQPQQALSSVVTK